MSDEHPSPPMTENERTAELMETLRAVRRMEEQRIARQDRGTLSRYYHGLASGLEGNSAA